MTTLHAVADLSVWMAAIALVFLAEKNWRHGAVFARVAGGGLAALGLLVVEVPSLLSTISRQRTIDGC